MGALSGTYPVGRGGKRGGGRMNGNAGTNQIGAMAYGDEGIEKGGGGELQG